MQILIAVALFAIVSSDPYHDFSKNSNGIAEYKWVETTPCQTGHYDTGYAIAPFGTVVLKQVNEDGTVSQPVCHD